MSEITTSNSQPELADELFQAHERQLYAQTDRLLAGLMVLQWIAGIIVALYVSPHTWVGLESTIHMHVWMAIILGGAVAAGPVLLTLFMPGRSVTRHIIGIAQALFGIMFIHLTGGRIETHFHVFASLAILSFYRDWKVLIPATAVVAIDHLVRGIWFPQSVYGVLVASNWRWVEHAGWVIVEDSFLILACVRGKREMWAIAQRTIEIKAATKDAEDANRAKSAFLANMSHEIRTPLNGVIGMLELLGQSPMNEEQTKFLRLGRTSADALLAQINEILDFSKIEAGKLDLSPIDFSVRDLVRTTIEILQQRAADKLLTLQMAVDPTVPEYVRADPDRIRQIVLNLVNNALKFTEKGSITVSLRMESLGTNATGHKTLRCEVTDTGIGIPPEGIDRLFKSFSQVDASTTRKYGGTGLGLAISRHLAELMGGDMGVRSQEGAGSTFWFSVLVLPVQPPAKTSASSHDSHQPLRHAKVLLVEDNEINQLVAHEVLIRAGFACDVVAHGAAALTALENERYDIVLMDCQMPVMDGFEATREIRRRQIKNRAGEPIPVAALTAGAIKGDRERCLDAGMTHYLTKPLDPREVVQTVRGCLTDKTPTNDPPASEPATPSAGPLDMNELKARLMNDQAMIDRLLKVAGKQLPEQLKALMTSLTEKDLANIQRLAHSLKGSAATMAAHAMCTAATQLDEAAKITTEVDGLTTLANNLSAEIERVVAWVAPQAATQTSGK